MIAVPAPSPETVPVLAEPVTVATAVLVLVHGPVPLDESVVTSPSHTDKVPVMTDGRLLTVTSISA
jgi:hypothetical protein